MEYRCHLLTYPIPGSNEKALAMLQRPDDGQDDSEDPDPQDQRNEDSEWDPTTWQNAIERVESDGQDKEAA